MSWTVNKVLNRLDYAGVCILIGGTTFPPMYYGFYCKPTLAFSYLFLCNLACGIVFVISMFDFIHTPKYFIIKGYMYGGLGVSMALPFIHLVYDEMYNVSLS